MNKHVSTYRILKLIQGARIKKKLKIYRRVFGVLFDKVTTFYSLIVLGYVFIAFFIFDDYFSNHDYLFLTIEQQANDLFPLLITVIPFMYIIKSFHNPGIIYSTSEYQLANLPYQRRTILQLLAIQQFIKSAIIYMFIGIAVYFLFPITIKLIISYISLFLFSMLLMTPIQWKLFQKGLLHKIVTILIFGAISGMNGLTYLLFDTMLVAYLFLAGLMIFNLFLFPYLLKDIEWEKVAEASDYLVWNMVIVSLVSKVEFERPKKSRFFRSLSFRKRPFTYTKLKLSHRLWQVYIGKNVRVMFQLTGMLLMLLIITLILDMTVFHIAIAVSIYIHSSVMTSFYYDRFSSDILEVLPWDLASFKRTLFPWAFAIFFILLVPIAIYSYVHFGLWAFLQVPFIVAVYIYNFAIDTKYAGAQLQKQLYERTFEQLVRFISLVVIWYSSIQPVVSVVGLIVFIGYFMYKGGRRKHGISYENI